MSTIIEHPMSVRELREALASAHPGDLTNVISICARSQSTRYHFELTHGALLDQAEGEAQSLERRLANAINALARKREELERVSAEVAKLRGIARQIRQMRRAPRPRLP